MVAIRFSRQLGGVALLGLLLSLSACDKNSPAPPAMVKGQTVRGKVTYKGEPVPYGFVLFYNVGKSLDAKTGTRVPSSTAIINSDGSYEMTGAAVGPVKVAVCTDPDVDMVSLLRPSKIGGNAPPGVVGHPREVGLRWPAGLPAGGVRPPRGRRSSRGRWATDGWWTARRWWASDGRRATRGWRRADGWWTARGRWATHRWWASHPCETHPKSCIGKTDT